MTGALDLNKIVLLSGPRCDITQRSVLLRSDWSSDTPSDWLNLEPLALPQTGALNLSKIVLLSGPRCDITQRSVPHVETINNADAIKLLRSDRSSDTLPYR